MCLSLSPSTPLCPYLTHSRNHTQHMLYVGSTTSGGRHGKSDEEVMKWWNGDAHNKKNYGLPKDAAHSTWDPRGDRGGVGSSSGGVGVGGGFDAQYTSPYGYEAGGYPGAEGGGYGGGYGGEGRGGSLGGAGGARAGGYGYAEDGAYGSSTSASAYGSSRYGGVGGGGGDYASSSRFESGAGGGGRGGRGGGRGSERRW